MDVSAPMMNSEAGGRDDGGVEDEERDGMEATGEVCWGSCPV
jgi:hypothetical protein